jgi:hypothetical protein
VTKDVVFERAEDNGRWSPVPMSTLQVGDTIRMKDTNGNIVDEGCRVSRKQGVDQETSCQFDLMLEPI